MLVQGENVVVVDGRCGWLEEKSSEMRTSTRKVAGVWRRVQGVFPSAVCGEVEWDVQVFVVLDGGLQPLLIMLGEVIMGEKWYCEWNIWLWWGQVAILECFVDDA